MTYSGHVTRTITTPNKGSRTVPKITQVILHHWAGTDFEGTLNMWARATRKASCNYAIGNEGQRVGVVPEEYRSWSVSNANEDSRSITFEIENESVNGWTVSSAAHESTAMIVADVARRYGIPLDRDHIIGHREVYTKHHVGYATACPGGLDMDWIVRRAREINGQGGNVGTVGNGNTTPAAGAPTYPVGTYNGYDIKTIQSKVGAVQDGVYGPETKEKVGQYQAANGLVVDGIVGPATWGKLQGGAPAQGGGAGLDVDGVWGKATTRALQRALGVGADGILGPITYRALQKRVGSPADGIYGPNTKRALQSYLKVGVDGIVGRGTISALQRRLNAGSF